MVVLVVLVLMVLVLIVLVLVVLVVMVLMVLVQLHFCRGSFLKIYRTATPTPLHTKRTLTMQFMLAKLQDWFTNLGFLHPELFHVLSCR